MTLNLEVVGRGATTKIYRDGDKAIKLYENAPIGEAQNEAARQQLAFDAGLPVPAVFGVRGLENNAVALYMEYIDAAPLLRPGMDREERISAIQTLVKLQRRVHEVSANGQPKQAERLAQKISQTQYLSEPEKVRLLDLLKRLDTGAENLCHGDFHPLNILFDGSKYWIIDWVDATAGNPLADACRTYLLFREHIQRMAGMYLRTFCKESGVKQDEVLAWLPVVAAAQLGENLDDKSKALVMGMIHTAL